MKNLSNWTKSAVLLSILSLTGGCVEIPVVASAPQQALSDRQIAQTVAQQPQTICRRIRPQAVSGTLPVYAQPDFRSTLVGEVSADERVYLTSTQAVRGNDTVTYVQINQPVAGYLQTQNTNRIDTLGYCNVRNRPSVTGLW